jgi:hypothetical protein
MFQNWGLSANRDSDFKTLTSSSQSFRGAQLHKGTRGMSSLVELEPWICDGVLDKIGLPMSPSGNAITPLLVMSSIILHTDARSTTAVPVRSGVQRNAW